MIVSHKHKFIFVKSGKVAGTSFELALRPLLGKDDISTPVVWYDEEKAKKLGLPGPQNHDPDYARKARRHNGRGLLHEHSWAYEIKGIVGDAVWNEYYTFTIERDPREKSISNYYHHRHPLNKESYRRAAIDMVKYFRALRSGLDDVYISGAVARICTLEQWLRIDRYRAIGQNYLRYSFADKIMVKKVYDYARLDQLCADIADMTGRPIELPKTKEGFRDRRPLSKTENALLERLFDNDLYAKEAAVLGIR